MKKIFFLLIVSILFILPSVLGQASSASYSVNQFGSGVAASTVSSATYSAHSVSTSSPSQTNAVSSSYTADVSFSAHSSSSTSTESSPVASTPSPSSGVLKLPALKLPKCDQWDCTSWSPCSQGKQTRVCQSVGSCIDEGDGPPETMSCLEPSYDLSLGLEDVSFVPGKNLLFWVRLLERDYIGSYDVSVTYTVLNENKQTLFERTEIKSLDGSLFYQMQIDTSEFSNGLYTLRVEVTYGNMQHVSAEENFTINRSTLRAGQLEASKSDSSLLFVFVLFVLLLVLYFRRNELFLKLSSVLHMKFKAMTWTLQLISVLQGELKAFILVLQHRLMTLRHLGKTSSIYPSNTLSWLLHKKVFTSGGHFIGEVHGVYLDISKSRIYGLLITADKRIAQTINGRSLLLKYELVEAARDVVLVHKDVPAYIEHQKEHQKKRQKTS